MPEGFNLFNGARQVAARGPDDSLILFSGGEISHSGDMASYLTQVWARNTSLSGVEAIDVNGMPGATGQTQLRNRTGTFDARLVAVRHDPDTIYRFMFVTRPAQTVALNEALRRTTFSFRKLTAADRARYGPWRIEMQVVRSGDTVASLSRNMPMPGPKDEWFRVLNGLEAGQSPAPGTVVKVVVE